MKQRALDFPTCLFQPALKHWNAGGNQVFEAQYFSNSSDKQHDYICCGGFNIPPLREVKLHQNKAATPLWFAWVSDEEQRKAHMLRS